MANRIKSMSIRGSIILGRAERAPVRRRGTLRERNKFASDVLIEDLSETGCLFRSNVPLPVGSLISVGIPGIAMHAARISRVDGEAHGCSFLIPITADDIAAAQVIETVAEGGFKRMREQVRDAGEPQCDGRATDTAVSQGLIARALSMLRPRRQ
jgi:hypothetical protein